MHKSVVLESNQQFRRLSKYIRRTSSSEHKEKIIDLGYREKQVE